MRYSMKTRILSMLLAMAMVMGIPMTSFAAEDDTNSVMTVDAGDFGAPEIVYTPGEDDYYKVISKTDYILAPGITESEIVLNSDAGSHRQVAHVVEVDIDNPYTEVIPSTYKMAEGLEAKDYKVQIMSQQAAYAEANGYGNVVAAMNLSLSWYDSTYYEQHPELVGEPLGYLVLDGEVYTNSQGQTSGAQTVLVINFDEKEGVARPADMPKTEIRSTKDAITGWEEQVIPANFGFLVKDGKNQYTKNHTSDPASRSFVGIKEDGSIVMVMNDGRQAPYSTGFNSYEMAEFMLSLGCVQAVNGDGGGSSAFLSQRPGETLKVNCSPSDGAERPTTHGILVISNAPATGEFVRANITSEYDYYAPGSTVEFAALGTDLVGTAAEIPADVTWQLADASMGTIKDGVFVSNGKEGTVTAQMVYNDAVVGEASVEIVMPENFDFAQRVIVVPFGATVNIAMNATINGGLHEVAMSAEQITLTISDSNLGTINGLAFTSASSGENLSSLEGTLTAKLNGTDFTAEVKLKLGAPSEVLFDFEEKSDLDEWKTGVVNGYHTSGFEAGISHAGNADGEVHNGNGSLRLETNGLPAVNVSAGGYAQVPIYLKDGVIVKDALSIGFWAYIPDEYENCWIRVLYWYDSNGDGTYDKKNTVTVINQPEVYNTWDESGWKYFSVDVSAYSSILIPGVNDPDSIFPAANHPNKGKDKEPNDYRFIEFMFPHTNTNALWQTYGSINGPFTIYIDNITADYSEAVDDREAPIFKGVTLLGGNDSETALEKNSIVTTASNVLNVTARVAEDETKENATGLDISSAKAYVDGVEVDFSFNNGLMSINDLIVADGVHRVKFEIADRMGNKAVVIRLIKVVAGVDASTIEVAPADATLDRLYGGSVYWMNLNATDIETIQSVKTVIDLNSTNHWELDHMELADGFTATYTIDEENNTATIVITRTGVNEQTGEAVLASLPIRILYFDTDIKMDGYTAETFWNSYDFWPQDLKVDVDMGEITYVSNYVTDILGAFSNEEFSVGSEMYTVKSLMDAEYYAERGTCHVHTPEAMQDVAATCTESGYTGRTYCDVCDSVVDWGTTVAAVGHTYKVVEGQLICDCGAISDESGLLVIEEKTYYAANGQLISGWVSIDEEWYYFDKTTYAGLDGEQAADGHIKFVFDKGRLTDGVWETTEAGIRYWYGPTYYKDTTYDVNSCKPAVIDGKTYLFNRAGYMQTGIVYTLLYFQGTSSELLYYDCGSDGSAILLTGPHKDYFYIDGVWQKAYQLVQDKEGNFYFINDGHKIAKNTKLYLSERFVAGKTLADGTPISVGTYEFDMDGKMILKHGIIDDCIYINGVLQRAYQLVEFEGNLYFVNDGKNRIAKNLKLYLSEQFVAGKTFADGTPIPAGMYEFDAEGKMVVKHGVIDDRIYINGVLQRAYQLVEFEGHFYFINDGNNRIAKNLKLYLSEQFVAGKTFADGTPIPVGMYEFDAEGKMVVKHGVIDDRIYINGVLQRAYQLVEFEGHFYFVNDGNNRIAKNLKLYLSEKFVAGKTFADGTAIPTGMYEFDAEGKMIVKHGVYGDYLYKNGVQLKAYQLVELDGSYYFINDGHKIAKNTILYLSEKFVAGKTFADGSAIPAGLYKFDAEGKMIIP